MEREKSICIITSGHLASNPRTVKEMSALQQAGFKVTVVYYQSLERLAAFDSLIESDFSDIQFKKLEAYRVGILPRLIEKLGIALCQATLSIYPFQRFLLGVLPRSLSLYRLAAKVKADLYIGHNLQSLPVVSRLAAQYKSRYAFDIEDAHSVEQRATTPDKKHLPLLIESLCLPGAAYLTAASPLYESYYKSLIPDLPPVTTILNVFPAQKNSAAPTYKDRKRASTLSFCWFSQTVGENRGLEVFLQALVQLNPTDVEIHFRGTCDERIAQKFNTILKRSRLEGQLYIHPQVAPDELALRISEHDVGLAIEPGHSLNNSLIVSNKILQYLQSGLAILSTPTDGQRWISEQISDAVVMAKGYDMECFKEALSELLNNRNRLQERKEASTRYFREHFNWAKEQPKLVQLVDNCFKA